VADRNRLETPETVRQFVTAGDAIVTVSHPGRNVHVTLWITRAPKKPGMGQPLWVKLLTGSDNTNSRHYKYVGCIWDQDRALKPCAPKFKANPAKIMPSDPRARMIDRLCDVMNGVTNPVPGNEVEVWHEGRCCFCHRELTQTESVRRGYGPECAKDRGLPYGKTTTPESKSEGEGEAPRSPERASPVTCPRCGAKPGTRCRDPRGNERPFHCERTAAEVQAKLKGEQEIKPCEAKAKRENVPASKGITSDPVVQRALELEQHGWKATAAVEQALHEAKGFSRWEPEHGLPHAAVRDVDGREYEMQAFEDENDDNEEEVA
jgi:hypothetical protein